MIVREPRKGFPHKLSNQSDLLDLEVVDDHILLELWTTNV